MANIFGTAGDDITALYNGTNGADTILLYSGNDQTRPGAGADSVNGGAGTDQVSYLDSLSAGVSVNLATGMGSGGYAQGDTYVAIENVFGTIFADTLTGNGANNRLSGYVGNDRLYGGGGADYLSGERGADFLDGGTGADIMEGGLNNDFYIVDNIGDVVQGEIAYSQGGGIDTVRSFVNYTQPTNIELVRLGNITDTTNLNATGNDAPGTLVGNAGNNVLIGRGGNDQLNGNAGDDTITGNTGRDTVVGGSGSDTFIYTAYADSRAGSANRDVVNGFSHGFDQIDLRSMDANTTSFGVDDAFTFIGSAGFSGDAGQLRTQSLGGANAILVEGDHNGDGIADFQVFINLTTYMTGSDFLL